MSDVNLNVNAANHPIPQYRQTQAQAPGATRGGFGAFMGNLVGNVAGAAVGGGLGGGLGGGGLQQIFNSGVQRQEELLRLQMQVQQRTAAFQTKSNIAKTEHDTRINSIRNMRG